MGEDVVHSGGLQLDLFYAWRMVANPFDSMASQTKELLLWDLDKIG